MKTIVILSHVEFNDSPYCSYVHSHAKALVKQGYKVIVLAAINWFPFLSNFQKRKKHFMKKFKKMDSIQKIDGVTVIYKKILSLSNLLYNTKINLNGLSYYYGIKKIFNKIYKKENIIFVDAHTFKLEGYTAYRLKKKYKNLKATVTLHGTSFFRNTKTKNGIKSIRKILNNIDFSICVSNKIEKIAIKCGVKNTKVIYNGINQYKIEEVDKNNYKFNLISVGSFIKRKNHNLTIQAISMLIKDYPEIKLNIIGEGIERKNLEQLIKDKKLENVVSLKGNIDNHEVLKLMNESYIFLMPSVDEGFGIVYAEAMKSGCITIGTISEGIDGFIKDGINGFLVKPEVKDIVNKIYYIYKNPQEMKKVAKLGQRDTEKLTWDNNAKQYINLF